MGRPIPGKWAYYFHPVGIVQFVLAKTRIQSLPESNNHGPLVA